MISRMRSSPCATHFVLRDFHDELMAKGRIPISLIRYEMTGHDRDVQRFFDHTPLSAFLAR